MKEAATPYDKLRHLEATPSKENWARIRERLEAKRKKKMRALLWKASGMAAVFLLLLSLGLVTMNNNMGPEIKTPEILSPVTTTSPPAIYPGWERGPVSEAGVAGTAEQHHTKPDSRVAQTTNDRAASELIAVPGEVTKVALVSQRGLQMRPLQTLSPPSIDSGGSDEEEHESAWLTEEEARQELLADNDQNKSPVPASDLRRWAVGPRFAPVYYNSAGGGSPIDPQFNSNQRTGQVNMSFGFAVSYSVGPKLKLRSGLHKVEYGYDTRSVIFSASPGSASTQQLRNIDYDFGSQDVVVKSASNIRSRPAAQAKDVNALNPTKSGSMNQELAYLEIPLEVQYDLIDRRLGLELIGGFSPMILTGNAVSLESGDGVTPMGEATNVNRVNLSSNLGLGLNYRVNPGMQLRLEPVFKYHWNTFSDGAEGFRPYSLGLYSGINIRF